MFRLVEPIVVLGIAYAIYKLFELFVRRKERMAMIEKLNISDGAFIPPDITKWFTPPTTPASWALRLGLLLMGVGLGLGIATFITQMSSFSNDEPMYLGLMMFFGGLGLLCAYIIEQKQKK